VVGTGGISHQVISDLLLVDGAVVTAVTSRDAGRADEFAAQYGIAKRFTEFTRMLASDIDAVYIGTPHTTHFALAAEATRAGRHVLCEKPLGMDAREARELSAMALEAGVFLMEAMWMKFNPLIARLTELINDGVLGEVRSVQASFGAAFPRDGSSRWQPGGSTLLDQGIYPITLAYLLLGRPDAVFAFGTVREDSVDLREHFTLSYSDGRFVQGACSMLDWLDSSAAVGGSDAYVTIEGGFWWASQMTIHHPLPRGQRRDEVLSVEREGNGYVPMLREVVSAIASGALEHPRHSAADTAAVFDIMDEIRNQITAD
jgi:predicted dehydrogenase